MGRDPRIGYHPREACPPASGSNCRRSATLLCAPGWSFPPCHCGLRGLFPELTPGGLPPPPGACSRLTETQRTPAQDRFLCQACFLWRKLLQQKWCVFPSGCNLPRETHLKEFRRYWTYGSKGHNDQRAVVPQTQVTGRLRSGALYQVPID